MGMPMCVQRVETVDCRKMAENAGLSGIQNDIEPFLRKLPRTTSLSLFLTVPSTFSLCLFRSTERSHF
jgi:hypothetical protein